MKTFEELDALEARVERGMVAGELVSTVLTLIADLREAKQVAAELLSTIDKALDEHAESVGAAEAP